MSRPLVVDIDGTLTRPDRSIEGRVMDALNGYGGPVVIATGKAFPYPVALCEFAGLDKRVIAENGGVVLAADAVEVHGDPDAIRRVREALDDAGHDLGWGESDVINRWRESELAVGRHVPRGELDEIAARNGLGVVDSGYAYHVKSPDVDKATGLETVAKLLDLEPSAFAAVGDSENDVELLELAGRSYAVANAHEAAKAAADRVTEGSYADGLFEALSEL